MCLVAMKTYHSAFTPPQVALLRIVGGGGGRNNTNTQNKETHRIHFE